MASPAIAPPPGRLLLLLRRRRLRLLRVRLLRLLRMWPRLLPAGDECLALSRSSHASVLPMSWSEKAAGVTPSRTAHTVLAASSPSLPCCLGRLERPTKASSRGHSQAARLPLSCSHTPGSPRASAAKAPGALVRKVE